MSQNAATVSVKATPRASRSEITGVVGSTLIVRVTAAPTDGKANAAVCDLIAERLGVPKSRVSVKLGHASRNKVVAVMGLDQSVVDAGLGLREQPRLF